MTSSPRRHRSLRRRWQRRIVIGLLGIAGLAVIALGLRGLLPDRSDRPAAERALALALTQLREGNPSAARDAAGDAVSADPNWGLAHAVLARTRLALDDGLAADASLDRAQATGFDMRRAHQLRAHAALLTGDLKRAQKELAATDPRYRAYADRVRADLALRNGDYRGALTTLNAAVAARPRDAATWVALARARRAAGDLGGAIDASAQAVAVDPRQTDALSLRGELVRQQYGLVASLPWFERALERDPRNLKALIEYAATLGDVGRTRDMLAALRRATLIQKGSPQALYLQAVLAARARKFDLARDILEHAQGALDDVPGVMMLRGILDLEAGDAAQAAVRLRRLVAMQPMNLTARKLLASAHARADASRNAIDVLAPMVARADADSYALTLSSRAYERIGDRAAASGLLDRAAASARGLASGFSPDNGLSALQAEADRTANAPAATIALIRGLIAGRDSAGALTRARALADAYPGVPAAQMLLGDVWMIGNRPADAANAYARAARVRFDEPIALKLVEALDLAGRRADAANALALFLSQNPQNMAAMRLSAHWQMAAEDYAAAVGTLEELRLRLGDRDAALLAELAVAYMGVDDDARGLQYAAAAYAISPQNAAVADAYGVALLATGDTASARDMLRKAAVLAPGHAGIAAHLREAMTAG